MTGALDTPMRLAAQDILGDLGREVKYHRDTEAYDPDTRRTTTTAVTGSPFTVITSPPLDVRFTRLMALDTGLTNIQNGDMIIYLPAKGSDVTPDTKGTKDTDSIDVDGVFWNVVNYAPIHSGEQIALYEIVLRRSGT